ncbi:MAG: methyltransferase domain-containing protein [Phycisphaerae bacterium]|nr:methyltransferase domain-containing protein [Phycisphaerae bacterium]
MTTIVRQRPVRREVPSPVTQHFNELGRTGDWARRYSGTADSRTNWSYVRRQEEIERLLSDVVRPGCVVVEIGPGSGNLVPFFARRGCTYRGFDAAPGMVDETRAAIARCYGDDPRATCEIGSIERLDIPDGAADVVVASGVLEYLNHLDAAIAELTRIVRPGAPGPRGGSALVTLPNASSLNRVLGRRLGIITRFWHSIRRATGHSIGPRDVERRAYTVRQVRAGFEQRGWRHVAVAYYDFELLPYPLNRVAPSAAFAAKRFIERRGGVPAAIVANGFVAQFERR